MSIFKSVFKEEKWGKMMTLSLLFHLLVFSTVLFGPYTGIHSPAIEDRTYYVDLVGPPSRAGVKTGERGKAPGNATKKGSHTPKIKAKTTIKAKRITTGKKQPVRILAKRISPKSKAPLAKESHSASELIDKAIAKIERKSEKERQNQVEKALNEIEKRVKKEKEDSIENKADIPGEGTGESSNGGKGGVSGVSTGEGTSLQLYQMEVENAIKNNWSYPAAFSRLKEVTSPEAVIIVTVKSNGKILKALFKRKSNSLLFDSSVKKAIEKSDPLPKFPPGYLKSYDEIEIKFNLSDLAQ